MLNFLAAGSGYRAQAGEAGFETGNIRRAMEDITFTMLSPAKATIWQSQLLRLCPRTATAGIGRTPLR